MNPPILAVSSSPTQPLRPRSREDGGHQSGPPIWNIPNYTGNDNDDGASRRPSATHVQLPSTVPPHQPPVAKAHRDSDATLYDLNHNSDSHMPEKTDSKKYSVSSTSDNPYAPLPHSSSAKRGRQSISVAPDISSLPFHSTPLRSVNFPPQEGDGDDGMPAAVEETDVNPEHEKKFTSEQRRERRGILAHLHNYEDTMRFPEDEFDDDSGEKGQNLGDRPLLYKMGSEHTFGSDLLPEESPMGDLRSRVMEEKQSAKIEGRGKGKDPKDVEFNRVARLPYKLRRGEQKKPVIEHQITCELYFILS